MDQRNDGTNDVNTFYRNMKDVEISYAKKTFPNLKRASLWWVYNTITSTAKKKAVENIRSKSDKKERKFLKETTLGYFNIGVFKDNYRNDDNLISTEFMLFDFDDLENVQEAKDKLRNNPSVYAAFISPSNGLKIIFRLEKPITDSDYFSQLYKYYAKKLGADLGNNPDHTSDCSRPCFFSYDPEMYVNENAIPLAIEGLEDLNEQTSKKVNRSELLQKFKPAKEGERHTFLTSKIGSFIKHGFDQDFALEMAIGLNISNEPPLSEDEVIETVEYLYQHYAEQDYLNDFWSQGKEIYQMGFAGDKFFIEKISCGKFKIIVRDRITRKHYRGRNIEDKKITEEIDKKVETAYKKLVIEKHIKHLARVDYIGDPEIQHHSYNVNLEDGVIIVRYTMLQVITKDNNFVEDYLQNLFGAYKDFIKKYLAVYCFSNYKKLPTLILFGGRGGGKSSYAEILMEIFPELSDMWQGNEQNFTYEAEKKLLVVEENNSDKISQYKTLKKYTGQKNALVHKKFKDPYKVMNNMNIIMLSNESVPLYVKKEELPTDEVNNQFFVYEFKKMEQQLDNLIQKNVLERLGYYIRTELKKIYDSLDTRKYRYSIPVPITQEEKDLFNVNTTEIDLDTDAVIQQLAKRLAEKPRTTKYFTETDFYYRDFIEKKLLPISFITEWNRNITKSHKNSLIKNLKKRKLIEASDAQKVQIKKKREYCYKMSQEFYNMLMSEFTQVE